MLVGMKALLLFPRVLVITIGLSSADRIPAFQVIAALDSPPTDGRSNFRHFVHQNGYQSVR